MDDLPYPSAGPGRYELDIPPSIEVTADDCRALAVGLGDRHFDNSALPYRELTMAEGFEVRLRCPRTIEGTFRLEIEIFDPAMTDMLSVEVDYHPVPSSLSPADGRHILEGAFPRAARDALILFFRLAPPIKSSKPIPQLRFRSLHLSYGDTDMLGVGSSAYEA